MGTVFVAHSVGDSVFPYKMFRRSEKRETTKLMWKYKKTAVWQDFAWKALLALDTPFIDLDKYTTTENKSYKMHMSPCLALDRLHIIEKSIS